MCLLDLILHVCKLLSLFCSNTPSIKWLTHKGKYHPRSSIYCTSCAKCAGSPSITSEYHPSLCGNVSKTSFHSNYTGYAILMFRWVDIPACSVCVLYIWALWYRTRWNCSSFSVRTGTPSDTSHQSPSSRTCNEHGCKPRCDSVSHFGRLVKVNLKDWPMKRH